MEISDPATRAVREGRLTQAHDLVHQNAPVSDVDKVLSAELLQMLGNTHDASRVASRLLQSTRVTTELKARCALVVAETRWQSGKLKEALDLYQKAVESRRTVCRLESDLPSVGPPS